MRKKKYFSRAVIFIVCALLALIFLLPTLLTISNSFMTQTEISANYGVIFQNASGSGGKTYVSEKVNLKFIPDKVSLEQYITVLLMLMPYQVTLVPNYLVSKWLHILDTRWAIILPGAFAPFSVFLLTKFMRRIPYSLIEAAKIDGAGEWQVFTRVCMPQCRAALYSIAILVFIDYWNMVEQPIVLLPDAEKQPLSVYLSTINTGEVGLAFAIATIYMVPTLLLFLHGEEYLVEGIATQGSVKG